MYLRSTISEFKTDITANIRRYNRINGTIKRNFGKNMLPRTKLWLYNITAKAALKCGSEVWVLNKKECRQLESAEMKFLRSLLGLTRLDHQRNTTIRKELRKEHIVDETQNYPNNRLQHVKRMENARIPRVALEYQPQGKRDIGRPKTRWTDKISRVEFPQDRT
jgi:hypothetical protein